MKKCKLQYVALAVAMGLSFSGSALAQDINITPPDDQKKALAYDFKNDIAYLREKSGSGKWEKLGVDPEKPQVIKGWKDVKNFSIIDEKHATNNEKSLQATRAILIKTVENVKELDRFVSTNMSDTAKNTRNLTTLQASHDDLDKKVKGLTTLVTKTDKMLENDQNLMTGLNNLATETANGFNRVE
ncbi:hypothetical protein ACE4RU_11870, partial [Actinobacillus seminis]